MLLYLSTTNFSPEPLNTNFVPWALIHCFPSESVSRTWDFQGTGLGLEFYMYKFLVHR